MRLSILPLTLLATLSLAQQSPNHHKRQFSNPVQPTASADDPSLTSRKPLSIATSAGSPSDPVTPSITSPGHSSETAAPSLTTLTGAGSSNAKTTGQPSSSASNLASVPTAFANAAVGLVAVVGLAVAL